MIKYHTVIKIKNKVMNNMIIMMMIKIMIITIEKELTSATENAKVISENVIARTFKQSHYKNPA